MKIVINGRFLNQPVTGVQRYARELVGALDNLLDNEENLNVELVTPKLNQTPPRYRNIKVTRYGRLQGHAWEQIELPRAVGRNLLFCPGNTAPVASLFAQSPVVVTVHDLSYRYFPDAYSLSFRALYGSLMPLVMRQATAVITVSHAEKVQILDYYPSLGARLVVVPNGGAPDEQVPEDALLSSLKPYVLYVGSFSRRKNIQTTLRVAEKLLSDRKELRFVLVGSSGGIFSDVEMISSDRRERMIFTGQINDTRRLMAYYKSAELLVFPSLYESSGLPPTEAMACGCPLVVSNIPALVERCGDAAVYCDPLDVEEIVGTIGRLLDSTDEREALSRRAIARSKKFTWQNCARMTLDTLVGNYRN